MTELEADLEVEVARAAEANELRQRVEEMERGLESAERVRVAGGAADHAAFQQLRMALESLSETIERTDDSVHSELTAVGLAAPDTDTDTDTEAVPPPDGAARGSMQTMVLRERLTQLEEEVVRHKAQNKELAGQLEARVDSSELERELVEHAQRVRDLETELTDRAQRVQECEEAIEQREAEIRGLEARLAAAPASAAPAGAAPQDTVPPVGDEAALREELMEMQARVGHLSEELLLARRQQTKSIPAGAVGDVDRLNEMLGDRDAELLMARSRLDNRERELRSLRDVATKVREDLEQMLGRVTASGDPGHRRERGLPPAHPRQSLTRSFRVSRERPRCVAFASPGRL